jgi:phosphonopyruvate decarboxylase
MKCQKLYDIFRQFQLTFFTGVPDSTFKPWMSFLDDQNGKQLTNVIAANECEAVAIAAGYYLATGKTGTVYLQNSGEGKTVNPLTSLCDPEVYSIPVLLMIGWRGRPGVKDEPQHRKMGRITKAMLDTLEIPYAELSADAEQTQSVLAQAVASVQDRNAAYALIVKPGMIDAYQPQGPDQANQPEMSREQAIQTIVQHLTCPHAIVSTTGKTSRELFETRIHNAQAPRDFYTVGGMGCAAAIGLGVALQSLDKAVVVFDGDGSAIMQMGTLATIGHYRPKGFHHFIFDNNCHQSTGKQPTVSATLDFTQIASACGYAAVQTVQSLSALISIAQNIRLDEGPCLYVVKVNQESRKDLGRPTTTCEENKRTFMQWLKGS